ncbi:type I methionyl aminopeptidase [Gammaproteobacteria bacterium]|nr:type I methionyl aminopeptidase [Gammaproteobacteria bacterium]
MSARIKTDEEIAHMRVACALAARTLDMIEEHVRPGVTTEQLNTICHQYITETLEATPAPLNYRGFPKSICTSVNHVICHGIPSDKVLKEGDIVNIDVTVIKNGFHGDTSRMYYLGDPSVRARRLVEETQKCLAIGIAEVAPGKHLGNVGAAIQHYAESLGFSVVREYCGHGIGRDFHEEPQVLHYGKRGSGIVLQPGMIFTIEPMINAGRAATRLLNDGWTVVTRDRSLSAQWEHTVMVTQDGVEILSVDDGRID